MDGIIRKNLDDAIANECAYSEVVEAGDWVFLNLSTRVARTGCRCRSMPLLIKENDSRIDMVRNITITGLPLKEYIAEYPERNSLEFYINH